LFACNDDAVIVLDLRRKREQNDSSHGGNRHEEVVLLAPATRGIQLRLLELPFPRGARGALPVFIIISSLTSSPPAYHWHKDKLCVGGLSRTAGYNTAAADFPQLAFFAG
jgi:hypothetical protein